MLDQLDLHFDEVKDGLSVDNFSDGTDRGQHCVAYQKVLQPADWDSSFQTRLTISILWHLT